MESSPSILPIPAGKPRIPEPSPVTASYIVRETVSAPIPVRMAERVEDIVEISEAARALLAKQIEESALPSVTPEQLAALESDWYRIGYGIGSNLPGPVTPAE